MGTLLENVEYMSLPLKFYPNVIWYAKAYPVNALKDIQTYTVAFSYRDKYVHFVHEEERQRFLASNYSAVMTMAMGTSRPDFDGDTDQMRVFLFFKAGGAVVGLNLPARYRNSVVELIDTAMANGATLEEAEDMVVLPWVLEQI